MGHSLAGMGSHAAPGGWNDPDFLELGNGGFNTVDTARAHFTMWCVTSSPLIASLDLKRMKPDILRILTNKDAIAINQNYAGNAGDLLEKQGDRISTCQWGRCYDMGAGEVWYKPLPDGEAAVALLNTQPVNNGTALRLNVSFANLA